MKKILLTVVLIMLAILTISKAESIKVTGTVTSKGDGSAIPAVSVVVKGTTIGTLTNAEGKYEVLVPFEKSTLVFSYIGYKTLEIEVSQKRKIDVSLEEDIQTLSEVVVTGYASQRKVNITGAISGKIRGIATNQDNFAAPSPTADMYFEEKELFTPPHNTEDYSTIHENIFLEAFKKPLSTFSIDVDRASYSNVRRFINGGQLPPKDAVRIEELINYFSYEYAQPKGDDPFSITTEISECPWNKTHRLVHVGLQGKSIPTDNLPASNLVFLVDVSGSMVSPEKLPLLKSGFKLLVDQLRPQDEVSIVVYAGAAGLVLEPTSGKEKTKIFEAIESLEGGGSTAGGEGIKLAYKVAKGNFKTKGNNRVILATDGDFNVGVSSDAEMERLIEEKRETGVFLSVLGFGMGNYKDSKMEILADKGNGNYAYIDNILEAKKVFVNEFGGTLFTIAKDVKIQVEFNPAKVKGYRLIGYENRALKDEDFNNDKKDAGELGSGHTVTALYEVIPADVKDSPYLQSVDKLKYQSNKIEPKAIASDELMTIKLRYKKPDEAVSKLIEKPLEDRVLKFENTSNNLRFAASVASFGMLLRDSEYKGSSSYADVLVMAKDALGQDSEGYRSEFLNLVRSMQLLAKK